MGKGIVRYIGEAMSGKKTKVNKLKNRYYDARGHGDPIDDITEYVKEIDVKENKNVK